MTVIALTLRTSLILALGMFAALLLRRRSAAMRHWILASAILCAGLKTDANNLLATRIAVSIITTSPPMPTATAA